MIDCAKRLILRKSLPTSISHGLFPIEAARGKRHAAEYPLKDVTDNELQLKVTLKT